jgi:hypothetical protein
LRFAVNGNQLTIGGTPLVPGSVGFDVTAVDFSGTTLTHNYSLTILPSGEVWKKQASPASGNEKE